MIKKKIYIHIGFGKTGTSAIQSLFSNRRVALLEQGFLYPETGLQGDVHHALAPLGADTISKSTRTLYDQLLKEMADSKADKVIISTEHFTFVKPTYVEDIKSMLAGFEIKIVFYVRTQESLIQSAFLQWQKVGDDYQGGVELFFRKHKAGFDFMKRIAPWANCFGEESIIARLYERTLIGDDVCRDIALVLGIEGLEFGVRKKENISLRPEFSALVNLMDNTGVSREDRTKIINELLRLSEYFDATKKGSLISSDLRKEISNFYRKSNLEFAAKYLEPEHAELLCSRNQSLDSQPQKSN